MARLKTILQRVRETIRPVTGRPTLEIPKKVGGEVDGRFSVLIIKIDHLGDFVTAIPALRRLRSEWNNADVTLLCTDVLVEFVQSLQVVDRVVGVSPAPDGSNTLGDEPDVVALRQVLYDVAIDLRHDSDTRHLLAAFRARFLVGYASRSHGPQLDVELPELEKSARSRSSPRISNRARLSLLVEAAIQSIQVPAASPERPDWMDQRREDGRTITIAPSARSPIKMWRTDRWIELCNRLIAQDFDIVLVGDEQDVETCNAIADGLPAVSFVNRTGDMTLVEVTEAIASSALFIGLDTGLSHIASSTGSSALVLFSGHADHEVWAPDGTGVSILRNEVPCAPCHATRMTQCLFDHRCMDLPLEFVWQATSAKLNMFNAQRPLPKFS